MARDAPPETGHSDLYEYLREHAARAVFCGHGEGETGSDRDNHGAQRRGDNGPGIGGAGRRDPDRLDGADRDRRSDLPAGGLRHCGPAAQDSPPPIDLQIGAMPPWARAGEPVHWSRRAIVTADGAVSFYTDDGGRWLAENGL